MSYCTWLWLLFYGFFLIFFLLSFYRFLFPFLRLLCICLWLGSLLLFRRLKTPPPPQKKQLANVSRVTAINWSLALHLKKKLRFVKSRWKWSQARWKGMTNLFRTTFKNNFQRHPRLTFAGGAAGEGTGAAWAGGGSGTPTKAFNLVNMAESRTGCCQKICWCSPPL